MSSLDKAPNRTEISLSLAVPEMVSDAIPADFNFWLLTKENVLIICQMVKGTALLK